jgi:hypothetical protein
VRTWIVLAVLYGAFFAWYTSFGGPLQPEEIEEFMGILEANDAPPERIARWRRFMETDSGDDFAMANFLSLAETPKPVEGVPAGESSADVMARYTTPFMGKAVRSAAHPVLYGKAAGDAMDLWGIEGAERWSHAGVVRYRSRRDLMEQVRGLVGTDIHRYKIAAMDKTIAFPIDPWITAGDPRLLLALVFLVVGLGLNLRGALARGRATG